MKPRILFVFDYKFQNLWRDGLWAALNLLKKEFSIDKYNLYENNYELVFDSTKYDFVLGWGAYGSPVDMALSQIKNLPLGICMAGNASPVSSGNIYNVIFYETEWVRENYLNNIDTNLVHA